MVSLPIRGLPNQAEHLARELEYCIARHQSVLRLLKTIRKNMNSYGEKKMTKKNVSDKVRRAADQYLASLDSSRDQLTDRQWGIVVSYIKLRRTYKPQLVFLLLLSLIWAVSAFWYLHYISKLVAVVVPQETIFVSKSLDEPNIPLDPDDIKHFMNNAAKAYYGAGVATIAAILFFSYVVAIPVHVLHRRKILESFIPRSHNRKTPSQENQPPAT